MKTLAEKAVPYYAISALIVVTLVIASIITIPLYCNEGEKVMTEPIMTNLPDSIGLDDDIFYYYKAHINKIYDGDTASSVDIDLGFGIVMEDQHIRFYGIDTPELRGDEKDEGKKVAQYVKERLEGKDVILKSYKDKKGKYGRWLGEFFVDGININWELLEKGYAKPYGK